RIIAGCTRIPLMRPWGGLLCRLGKIVDRAVSWFDDTPVFGKPPAPAAPARKRGEKPVAEPTAFSPWQQYAVGAWLLVQLIVPLRGALSLENPAWTGAGSTFAWRGDRIDKQSRLHMGAIQSSRQMRWPIDPTDDFPVPLAILFTPEEMQQRQLSEGGLRDLLHSSETMLPIRLKEHGFDDRERDRLFRRAERLSQTHLSRAQFALVSQRPDLVWQYAQHLAAVLNEVVNERMPVEAELQFSLNNRPWEVCLSDDVDLTKIPGPTELSSRLRRMTDPLPPATERVEVAEALAAERRATEGYDMGTRRPPEPVKAPPLTDDDDAWIREHFPERSASRADAK
ncbi:MAG TPA: HTTM domain-containing protein, partial [Planctomycetaceae bacterium]|nr:HTTM domain-containing protein [Planctomycetaceae bacterium]